MITIVRLRNVIRIIRITAKVGHNTHTTTVSRVKWNILSIGVQSPIRSDVRKGPGAGAN